MLLLSMLAKSGFYITYCECSYDSLQGLAEQQWGEDTMPFLTFQSFSGIVHSI
jgi:hypothetical protein